MKRYILAALPAALLAVAIGTAQQSQTAPDAAQGTLGAVVVDGLQDGTYLLTVTGGTATVNPIPVIRPGGPPVPPTPVPPAPDDLTARAREFMQAAAVVQGDPARTETAGQLAELYRQIGNKIEETKIQGPEAINLAVTWGTKQLLNGRGSAAAAGWKPVQELLDQHMMRAAQDGLTDAGFVALLADVSDGLDASAPNQPQLDIAKILQIITMIMEIIALFS